LLRNGCVCAGQSREIEGKREGQADELIMDGYIDGIGERERKRERERGA
jgi:hypothetical protein